MTTKSQISPVFPSGSLVPIGITDLTHAVDTKSKAVLAAEEFAADICRLEIMKGEYEQLGRNILAQQDKVLESKRLADDTMQAEIKRVTG